MIFTLYPRIATYRILLTVNKALVTGLKMTVCPGVCETVYLGQTVVISIKNP